MEILVCTWHDLEDQTFCGRSTDLRVRSQNRLRHRQTIGKIDFVHSSHMNADSIVMWATLLSIVDWVLFSRLRLCWRASKLKLMEESYVSSEAEHLSPSGGGVRNKHQCPTVLQSLKSFRWMLDCAWMVCLLSFFGTL